MNDKKRKNERISLFDIPADNDDDDRDMIKYLFRSISLISLYIN